MLERIVLISERCRACRRCEVACIAAHHGMDIKEATKRRAEFISRVRVIKGEGYKTTTRCHECENAPCCNICPTGALEQLESAEVVMHEELCIACEMCADACPYGAIQMDVTSLPVVKMEDNPDDEELTQPRKVAVRCDLCREWRKANGKAMTPCMEACPAQCIGLLQEDGSTLFPEKPQRKPIPTAKTAQPEEPKPSAQAAAKAASAEAQKPGAAQADAPRAEAKPTEAPKAEAEPAAKAEAKPAEAPKAEEAPKTESAAPKAAKAEVVSDSGTASADEAKAEDAKAEDAKAEDAKPEDKKPGIELKLGKQVITVENAPEPPAETPETQDKSA